MLVRITPYPLTRYSIVYLLLSVGYITEEILQFKLKSIIVIHLCKSTNCYIVCLIPVALANSHGPLPFAIICSRDKVTIKLKLIFYG